MLPVILSPEQQEAGERGLDLLGAFFLNTPSVTIEQLSATEYQYWLVITAAGPRIYFWRSGDAVAFLIPWVLNGEAQGGALYVLTVGIYSAA